MGATLDALHKLQAIDQQVRSVRDRIESKRRAAEARRRNVEALQRQIENLQKQIRSAQAEADRLDLDRKTHEAHAAKLREALNRAKTNKEHAAILTELNTDQADLTKTEDAMLAAMGRVDELKKEFAEIQKSREEAGQRAEAMTEEAESLRDKLAEKLASLESMREEAASDIPPEARSLFFRASDKHEGEGMALVEKSHPKRADYTCNGCNMTVTLETVNALQSSRDQVMVCQTCGRILYLEEPSGLVV
jgi:predicted  nucleic acid-binding Zn-ribbon protein